MKHANLKTPRKEGKVLRPPLPETRVTSKNKAHAKEMNIQVKTNLTDVIDTLPLTRNFSPWLYKYECSWTFNFLNTQVATNWTRSATLEFFQPTKQLP